MITNSANANAEYMRTERRIASALRDNVRRSGEGSINLNGSLVATSHRCGRRPGTLVKLQSHDSSPYLEGGWNWSWNQPLIPDSLLDCQIRIFSYQPQMRKISSDLLHDLWRK